MFNENDFREILEEYLKADTLETASIKYCCGKRNIKFGSFHYWLNNHPDLFDLYTKAREQRAHADFDLLTEFVMTPTATFVDEKGNTRKDPGSVAEKRMQFESLKWITARKNKMYGDASKLDQTITAKIETMVVPDFSERPE